MARNAEKWRKMKEEEERAPVARRSNDVKDCRNMSDVKKEVRKRTNYTMVGKPFDRGYSEESDQEAYIPYDKDMPSRDASFGNDSAVFCGYRDIHSNDDFELFIQDKDITEITENRRKHRLEYSYQIPSKKVKNLWSKRDKEAIKEKNKRREEYNKIAQQKLKEREYAEDNEEKKVEKIEIKEKTKLEVLKQLALAKAAEKGPLPLTPLPDRYFHIRRTVRAIAAGYHSLALICDICKYAFKSKATYQTHLIKHKRNKTYFDLPGMIECPWKLCAIRSDCTATLIAHLQRDHSHPEFPFEVIMFRNIDEFNLWKVEMERLTTSKFIKGTGKRNVNSITMYYSCHLSGKPIRKSTSQNLRIRRSKKIGRTCPAFMHIKETLEGIVEMRGCLTHCGHEVSVKNIPLTDTSRDEIAQLLIEGRNEQEIVDKMIEKYNKSDRRYYLQPRDVRNIANKMNKTAREAMLSKSHKTSTMESAVVKDEDCVPNRIGQYQQKVHFEDEPKPSQLMTQFAPVIPAKEKNLNEIITRIRKNATPIRRSEQRWLRSSEGPSH